jgi:hypothetical protein
MIASTDGNARMKVPASSRFAAIPLKSRSGGRSFTPGLMPTRNICRPTWIIRISISGNFASIRFDPFRSLRCRCSSMPTDVLSTVPTCPRSHDFRRLGIQREDVCHLQRQNPVASSLDDVLHSIRDPKVSMLVDMARIVYMQIAVSGFRHLGVVRDHVSPFPNAEFRLLRPIDEQR